MPWCERCERFWNPASVTAEGCCPACGRRVAAVSGRPDTGSDTGPDPRARGDATAGGDPEGALPAAPWHFKLLLVALGLYLGFRLWQGIAWLIGHL